MRLIAIATLWIAAAGVAPASESDQENARKRADRAAYDMIVASLERLSQKPYFSDDERNEFKHWIVLGNNEFADEPAMHYWTGEWHRRQRRFGEAKVAWEKALEATSQFSDVANERLWARCCLVLGYQALENNDGDAADKWACRVIEWAPTDVNGFRLLIDASLLNGRIAEAAETLRKAAANQSKIRSQLQGLYYDLLAQMGNWDALQDELRERLKQEKVSHVVSHYRARLAEAQRQPQQAFLFHYIAMQNGLKDDEATVRSTTYVDRQVQRLRRKPRSEVESIIAAYALADRRVTAEEALDLLAPLDPRLPEAVLVVSELRAIADAALNRLDESASILNGIIERWPDYVPARCLLGDVLEATGKPAEADRQFAIANRMSPENLIVRQGERLGGRYQPTIHGVRIRSLRSGGPLDKFGLKVGDELLEVDEEDLGQMPPRARIRWVKSFRGGAVRYRTASGKITTREMEYLYTPD